MEINSDGRRTSPAESSFVCSLRQTSDAFKCSGHPRYPGSIVPLLSCKGDISYHLSSYHISQKNIQSEGELLKLRAGMFNESDESLTVCPNHRYHLGLGWRCSRFCSLGWMCSKKNRANNKGTLTKEQSIFIFNTENNLIGVGSGICSKCRMVLLEKMRTTANEMCLAEEEYFIPVDEELPDVATQKIDAVDNEIFLTTQKIDAVDNEIFLTTQKIDAVDNDIFLTTQKIDAVDNEIFLTTQKIDAVDNEIFFKDGELQESKGAVSMQTAAFEEDNTSAVDVQMHIAKDSSVADHCCNFALSGDKDFSADCYHNHDQKCLSCEGIMKVLSEIEGASNEVSYESEDQRDEILYTVTEGKRLIQEWKRHIIRTFNQDLARADVIANLKKEEILIERDWAMKFIPMVYRESQSKWFGKRGLNWHITVGTFRDTDDEIASHTIVHIFDNAPQDAKTSNAVLENTLALFHEKCPDVTCAYLRSDNAGCFHGYASIYGILSININSSIQVKRMDFSDPQGGKSICDRRAAHIKSAIRKFVNEGNDVKSAREFLTAVKESRVGRITIVHANPPTQAAVDVNEGKLKNIMTLNNFLYSDGYLHVWRQYDIGKGQSYKLLSKPPLQSITIIESADGMRRSPTSKSAHQRSSSKVITFRDKAENPEHAEVEDQPAGQTETPTHDDQNVTQIENQEHVNQSVDSLNGLFVCPEVQCRCTFTKYGNLMRHLDIGNHNNSKLSKSLSDRSKILYSHSIQEKNVHLPHSNAETVESTSSSLQKGWALKGKREVKRFTVAQKEFLTSKFDIGETSGQKCDPEDVALDMRSVKDSNGKRLFKKDDFLSANQIASFFSRLALKKRKSLQLDYSEEDQTAEKDAENFDNLSILAAQID